MTAGETGPVPAGGGEAALSRNQFKQFKRLKTRRGRQEAGKFLLEGIKVIAAAAAALPLEQVIAAPELLGCAEGRALRAQLAQVPWRVARTNWLEQLADTVTAQGAIAVAPLPAPVFTPERWRRVLLFDRVQDPGNVGTLLRAACAFGFDAVLALPGSADFFNEKVLRAAAGYGLKLPLLNATAAQVAALRAEGFVFAWGNPHGGTPVEQMAWPEKLALWAGNEARGLDPQWQTGAASVNVSCAPGVESLNVALATAIIMAYQFTGGKGRKNG